MEKTNMNRQQQQARKAIEKTYNWFVGEWINAYMDGEPDAAPETIEAARATIYHLAMDEAPKEVRFCGKQFCEKCIRELFDNDPEALEIWGK